MSNEEKPLYDFYGQAQKQDSADLLAEIEREKIDFQNLMNSSFGFKFVKSLIAETGVFTPNRANNSSVYANEGRRSVGLAILEKVKVYTPEKVVELIQFEGDLEKKK